MLQCFIFPKKTLYSKVREIFTEYFMKTIILSIIIFIGIEGFSQDQSPDQMKNLNVEEYEQLLRRVIQDDQNTKYNLALKLIRNKKKMLPLIEEALKGIELVYLVRHVEEGSSGAEFILGMMFCLGINVPKNFDTAKKLLQDYRRDIWLLLDNEERNNCLG